MAHHVTLIPEWAEQDLVLITWPNATMDWAYMLPEVEACYIELAHAILEWEDLLVLARDPEHVRTLLMTKPLKHELFVMEMDNNDTWCRDYAPLSLMVRDDVGKERPMIVDFTFNAWGLKFPAHKDNLVSRALFLSRSFIAEMGYTNALSLTFEGGGIESDGQGTLLTTASVLFEPNRNASLSEEALQGYLREVLGADRLIVLEHGALEGDDTDGHIDTIVRIAPNNTIVYVGCEDTNDEQYNDFKALKEQLIALKTLDNKPYRLLELPMPKAIYDDENQRLPATYANFLIINNAVILPTYNQPENDKKAVEVLQEAFPDREIISIDAQIVIEQHGSLHCLTMQIPQEAEGIL